MKKIMQVLQACIIFLLFPSFAYAQCSEPTVDNATVIVPDTAATGFAETDTLTFTTKDSKLCAGETAIKPNSAFATPIFSNDDIVYTDSLTGALEQEKYFVNVNSNPAIVRFPDEQDISVEKRENVYESGAIYRFASIRSVVADGGFEQDSVSVPTDTASVAISASTADPDSLSELEVMLFLGEYSGEPTLSAPEGQLDVTTVSSDTLQAFLSGGPFSQENLIEIEATGYGETDQSIEITDATAKLETPEGKQSDFVLEQIDLPIENSKVTFSLVDQLIAISQPTIEFGEIVVSDPGQDTLEVQNFTTEELLVQTDSTAEPFGAEDSIEVAAESSASTALEFDPTRTIFGEQEGQVTFFAFEDSSEVSVSGVGVGGRGDPTLNGLVNVFDVNRTSDIILEQYDYSEAAYRAADVFPIAEEGDSSVTVTDLETTVNAILTGTWGDGEDIPETFQELSDPIVATQNKEYSGGPKLVLQREEPEKTSVIAKNVESSRGLQASFESDGEFSASSVEDLQIKSGKPSNRRIKVLTYKQSGDPIGKFEIKLGTINKNLSNIKQTKAISAYENETVNLTVEKKQSKLENKIAVYPNPSSEEVTIEIELKSRQEGTISLYDILGRKVATLKNGPFEKGNFKIEQSVNQLSSGAYFLKFQGESYQTTKKITVIR